MYRRSSSSCCNTDYETHNVAYVVHSPTNALFVNLVKSFKFTLKYTVISLLHVSVFNGHHQGTLSVSNYSYIYVKTLGKITSLYALGDRLGVKTWSVTLREERKLRVFENMVLRRIFGPRRDEVTGEWRRLHNEEPNDLYSSPNIVRVIKSIRMRWVGHVARMGGEGGV